MSFTAAANVRPCLLLEVFERYGVTVSIVHDGQTQGERFMNMQMFENGESKIIISIDVLGFGWNFPELRNIYNLAPTKSITRILQRLGRGARARDGVLKEGMTREERLAAIAADEKNHFKWYDGTETISGFQMKSTTEIIDEAEERERNKRRRKNSRKNKGEGGDENYEPSEYDPNERRERRRGIVVGHDFQHRDRDVDTAPVKKKRGWRMLWGPFKGKLIAELPTNYLQNVLRNRKVPKTEAGKAKHKEPPIYSGIRRELQQREAL